MLLAARVAADRSEESVAAALAWVRSVAIPLSCAVIAAWAACAPSSSSAVFAHTTVLEPAGSRVGAFHRAGVDSGEAHPATAPTAIMATTVNTLLRSIGRLPRQHTTPAGTRRRDAVYASYARAISAD